MSRFKKVEVSFIVFLAFAIIQFSLWMASMHSFDPTTAKPIDTAIVLAGLGLLLSALWFVKAVINRAAQLGVLTETDPYDADH